MVVIILFHKSLKISSRILRTSRKPCPSCLFCSFCIIFMGKKILASSHIVPRHGGNGGNYDKSNSNVLWLSTVEVILPTGGVTFELIQWFLFASHGKPTVRDGRDLNKLQDSRLPSMQTTEIFALQGIRTNRSI
eukprot:TRINITY_DN3741_c0_g1_i2.p1 TRINITY_DN3741_c0_g1~~TRINITY_DN3741_c0_g1_i2.p1  ORF type:complete len:134 (-),score=2.07 TRINITY_DN3741_c0_g1_i2:138-539(-)